MKDLHVDRRYGKFSISLGLIEEMPELVKAIMAEVIIVRAEMNDYGRVIQYDAISEMFRPMPAIECGAVPTYTFKAEKDESGKVKILAAEEI